MKYLVTGVALFVLSGCASGVSQAQSHLQDAIDLYGVAKGIGEVAALVDPAAGAAVAAITAVADPLVARAQAAVTDAAAIETLSGQITAQADAITLRAAPAVQVVPAVTP